MREKDKVDILLKNTLFVVALSIPLVTFLSAVLCIAAVRSLLDRQILT